MSDHYVVQHTNPNWRSVVENCVSEIWRRAIDGDLSVSLSDVIRTLNQNARMWPMLADFAKQVMWPINGEKRLISADDWKDLLTAAFEKETRMAPSVGGSGFVLLGARTSKYGKRKMADFITFIYAEGNERGVHWSETSREHMARYADIKEARR